MIKGTQIEEISYNEFLAEVDDGDLYFTASKHPLSFLIRYFSRGKVSHVGTFFWCDTKTEGQILRCHEANVGQKYMPIHARNRLKEEDYFYWGRIPDELVKNSIHKQLELSCDLHGKDYDYFGALSSLFIKKRDEKYFCSEIVAEIKGIRYSLDKKGITPVSLTAMCGFMKKVVF